MFFAKVTGTDQVLSRVSDFARIAGRSLEEEIIGIARLVAVSLATSTQPYGKTKAAKEAGERRVEIDIRKVFRTPSNIFEQIREEDPDQAKRWWRAFSAKDTTLMESILWEENIDIPINPSPLPSYHKEARGHNGRVKGRARLLVTDSQALRRYVEARKKKVGFAKAGFAKAADECGGHRGIPAWASSRHGTAPGGAVITRDPLRPRVVLYNNVSYVSRILPPAYQEQAITIAYERAMKRYTTAIRKQAAATFRRAS